MKTDQKGAAPILILVAIIGVVAFLAISSYAPFKSKLLSSLFPKYESKAFSAIPSPFPNCTPLGGQVPEGQAVPPYDPTTLLGGLEAEPQGPIWCFPLVAEPTTRV